MRIKKNYPDGTFIPTPARVCAIIQLCLSFSALLWFLSTPFLEELFDQKSNRLLFEKITQNKDFDQLPQATKALLQTGYDKMSAESHRPFRDKILDSLNFSKLPMYELAWIILAILIPILVLKKVEGAKEAVWLLPLITLGYVIHVWTHPIPKPSSEMLLFPKEDFLVSHYMETPLSDRIEEQQQQLMSAWHIYLVKEWAHEELSKEPSVFTTQLEKGEFAFNVARMERRIEDRSNRKKSQTPSPMTLIFYLIWNIVFAFVSTQAAVKIYNQSLHRF